MKISDIYVSTTGYLLQEINIYWYKKNIQHYMLDHNFSTTFKFTPTNKKYWQYLC